MTSDDMIKDILKCISNRGIPTSSYNTMLVNLVKMVKLEQETKKVKEIPKWIPL